MADEEGQPKTVRSFRCVDVDAVGLLVVYVPYLVLFELLSVCGGYCKLKAAILSLACLWFEVELQVNLTL